VIASAPLPAERSGLLSEGVPSARTSRISTTSFVKVTAHFPSGLDSGSMAPIGSTLWTKDPGIDIPIP
jgi:hypothetical protein